ncbi:hypothetical protein BG006_010570 [Podila minutissima]|uniref:DUF221-domain-containing protein n=1 Tax=Podila minutissima TaxID=64525 RepID=A0A9P5SFV4_9FUNG|nr:hypothetical protein BG006_010570 [Podila minutissima]
MADTDASVATFVSSAIFTAAVSVALFLVFALVRTRFPRVYSPKTYMGPDRERPGGAASGPLGWIFGGRRLNEQEVIERCGLDAYMFLDFLNKSFYLFFAFALLAIPILIPLNAYHQLSLAGLNQFSIANVADTPRLWGHLVLTVLFCVATLTLCMWSVRTYISRRQRYLMSEHHAQSLQATTVLVCGIQPGEANIQSLNRIFGVLPGGVRRIWLAYEAKQLQKDCTKRIALINKLEVAECALIRSKLKLHAQTGRRSSQASAASTDLLRNRAQSGEEGGAGAMQQPDESFPSQNRPRHRISSFPLSKLPCGGEKLDSILAYRSELSNMNSAIVARQQAGMQGMHENEKENKMNSAFIQFNHQLGAHLAAQSVVHRKTLTMSPRHLEVHPQDVLWDNLGYSLKERNVRKTIATVLAFFLIVLWTIPVTFVASVASLDTIVTYAPFLSGVYNLPESVVGIIQGLLPPIGLALLMMVLPIILYKLAHFGGEVLSTRKSLEVVTSYHWFSVVHVLLVTTLANGIFAAILAIKENPYNVMNMLASTLPQASTFFLSFILLSFIQIPLMLLQIGPLIMYHVGKFTSSTPRQMFATERAMGSVDWGMTIPVHTIAFSIGLLYSTIQPLILPLMVIYFGLKYLAFRHLFLYVYRQPFDSGGLIYPRIVDQMYVAVILFEIVMMGLFVLQKAIGQSVVMFILLVASAMAILISRNRVFKPLIRFLPMEAFDRQGVVDASGRALESGAGVSFRLDQERMDASSASGINPVPAQEVFHEKAPYKDPHSPLQEPTSREIYSPDMNKSPSPLRQATFLSRHSRQNSEIQSLDPSTAQTNSKNISGHNDTPSSDSRSQHSNHSPLPSIRVESMSRGVDNASNISLPGTPTTQHQSITTTASSSAHHQQASSVQMNRQTSKGSQISVSSGQGPSREPQQRHTTLPHSHPEPPTTQPQQPQPKQHPQHPEKDKQHRHRVLTSSSLGSALLPTLQHQESEYGGSLQVLGANHSILSTSRAGADKRVPDSLAYVNPALWIETQPVWLPQDPRGFAEIETMELTNAGLKSTTEQAMMDMKGKIAVDVGEWNVAPGDEFWD